MKPSLLILLLLLAGRAGFAQSGMTVFGDCYVQEKASMSVFVEKLTLEADVNGDGELIMAGQESQTIDAKSKAVDHLVVRNAKGVKVKGNLTVRKSLTIGQGNLAVLPQAQLTVLPGTTVTLSAGCHLIRVDEQLKTRKEAVSQTAKPFHLVCEVSESTAGQEGRRVCKSSHKSAIATLAIRYDSPDLQGAMPPPW
ncbi:hypothetical protein ACS5NO_29760 [Larkinella sp. GY13]|uniref:hypothetical protein n=1 Tax=Larkinella sp. GY13 TaxID=3453720 RepID=UPI003EEE4E8A